MAGAKNGCFLLATEFAPPSGRARAGALISYAWLAGLIYLVATAWTLRAWDWRWLVLSSAPGLLVQLLLNRALPESPRFTLMGGDTDAAKVVLLAAIRTNGRRPPDMLTLRRPPHSTLRQESAFAELWRPGLRMLTAVVGFCQATCTMCFCALSQHRTRVRVRFPYMNGYHFCKHHFIFGTFLLLRQMPSRLTPASTQQLATYMLARCAVPWLSCPHISSSSPWSTAWADDVPTHCSWRSRLCASSCSSRLCMGDRVASRPVTMARTALWSLLTSQSRSALQLRLQRSAADFRVSVMAQPCPLALFLNSYVCLVPSRIP